MSRVYKCDRCKVIYENNNKYPDPNEEMKGLFIGGISFENTSGIQIPKLKFNLCDECLCELLKSLGKEDLKED